MFLLVLCALLLTPFQLVAAATYEERVTTDVPVTFEISGGKDEKNNQGDRNDRRGRAAGGHQGDQGDQADRRGRGGDRADRVERKKQEAKNDQGMMGAVSLWQISDLGVSINVPDVLLSDVVNFISQSGGRYDVSFLVFVSDTNGSLSTLKADGSVIDMGNVSPGAVMLRFGSSTKEMRVWAGNVEEIAMLRRFRAKEGLSSIRVQPYIGRLSLEDGVGDFSENAALNVKVSGEKVLVGRSAIMEEDVLGIGSFEALEEKLKMEGATYFKVTVGYSHSDLSKRLDSNINLNSLFDGLDGSAPIRVPLVVSPMLSVNA